MNPNAPKDDPVAKYLTFLLCFMFTVMALGGTMLMVVALYGIIGG